MDFKNFKMPYSINPDYTKKTAYFSMEFAIDQALKIYSGGLGTVSSMSGGTRGFRSCWTLTRSSTPAWQTP